jgi:maltokinase
VSERQDSTEAGEAGPVFASSSSAADERLLAALRASWPPVAAVPAAELGRGYVAARLGDRPPGFALRVGDRHAVALVPEADGAFLVVPLARDAVAVDTWRRAAPGDGLSAFVAGVPLASERAIAADQTNESVVVGERAIVKWFRRIGPEPGRAATLLVHLDAVGFAGIPAPLGSLTWRSPAGVELTIAQGDAFLAGARDGWEWCLARLERHVAHGEAPCPAACDPWIGRPLGRLVARLHGALRTSSGVIAEPVAQADPSTVAAWRQAAHATLGEAVALEAALAVDHADMADPSALAALAPAIRADLDALPADRSIEIQPVHGDLHVGQVLEWPGGLAVIDFDGNPTLDAAANALRQPAERDIAQMTASLDHLARIVIHRSAGVARPSAEAWLARTRRDFLGVLDADPGLLAAFEVEQECRELVYAARFLPRWRYAPLAALRARYGR